MNFERGATYVARNILRVVTEAAEVSATAVEITGSVLFRVLKRFPEAYRAVVAELRLAVPASPIPSQ